VHKSLKNFEDTTLHVNLTEKVGKNTWYRGKINNQGENVWVHSSQTKEKPQIKQSKTSKLGHIRGGHRLIYKSLGANLLKQQLNTVMLFTILNNKQHLALTRITY